jgi:hypothetical protein
MRGGGGLPIRYFVTVYSTTPDLDRVRADDRRQPKKQRKGRGLG